jgi:hypothetical protein
MSWFYLSFASDEGFLGGCYVPGEDVMEAVKRAWLVGCNPGGEVQGAGPMPDAVVEEHVPAEHRERLLSYSELEALHDMAPWPATD